MDKKIKILIISAAVLIISAVVISLVTAKEQLGNQSSGIAELAINQPRFSLGTVSMADGLARHIIELGNSGTVDLKINSIKTSCMCTEAVLQVNGRKSPKFGMHTSSTFWSETINPGQTASLEITFDPNAHGPNATGPVTRVVTLFSNDQGKSNVKTDIIFTANVVK